MLKGLGKGSCFFTEEGNTSLYHLDENNEFLLIIDCGESVFERIRKYITNLNKVKKIYVMISHLHSDHSGSLPSFIFYCKYALNIKPIIIYPDGNRMKLFLKTISGVSDEFYELYSHQDDRVDFDDFSFVAKVQEHTDKLNAYYYLLEINKIRIYYSGDAMNLPILILKRFKEGFIDYIYQDVTCYGENNRNWPHMHIDDLAEDIPIELRKKVFCMHFDNYELIQKCKKLGFNVLETEEDFFKKAVEDIYKSLHLSTQEIIENRIESLISQYKDQYSSILLYTLGLYCQKYFEKRG